MPELQRIAELYHGWSWHLPESVRKPVVNNMLTPEHQFPAASEEVISRTYKIWANKLNQYVFDTDHSYGDIEFQYQWPDLASAEHFARICNGDWNVLAKDNDKDAWRENYEIHSYETLTRRIFTGACK